MPSLGSESCFPGTVLSNGCRVPLLSGSLGREGNQHLHAGRLSDDAWAKAPSTCNVIAAGVWVVVCNGYERRRCWPQHQQNEHARAAHAGDVIGGP